MSLSSQQIEAVRCLAQACFQEFYHACLARRMQPLSAEILQECITPLLTSTTLDPLAQQTLLSLLEEGKRLYQFWMQQGKVFVGIDDGQGILCLACAGTLQGQDAITDLFTWCQRYAVCGTDPVAGYLNCEICNDPLIPPGYPDANT